MPTFSASEWIAVISAIISLGAALVSIWFAHRSRLASVPDVFIETKSDHWNSRVGEKPTMFHGFTYFMFFVYNNSSAIRMVDVSATLGINIRQKRFGRVVRRTCTWTPTLYIEPASDTLFSTVRELEKPFLLESVLYEIGFDAVRMYGDDLKLHEKPPKVWIDLTVRYKPGIEGFSYRKKKQSYWLSPLEQLQKPTPEKYSISWNLEPKQAIRLSYPGRSR